MKMPVLPNKIKNHKNKNIALMGHMGSGKTLLGKLIAKELNFQHLDSDKLIENNTKKTINEIFKKYGESKFRAIEEEIIISLKNKKNIVLSLGGGSILSKITREFLKKYFITVYIDVNVSILTKRLKNSSKRPLLLGVDIEKKINELNTQRKKYFLLADIKIKNNENPVDLLSAFKKKYKLLNEKNNKN